MHILKNQNKYFFFNALTIEQVLKPTTYLFNFDNFGNCWLEDVEDFNLPEKIYDVNVELKELVKKSFENYNKNLGVLLSGNKGQGKTLTAKLICKEMNLPVILINKPIPQDVNFINFFNTNIKQNYVLFIDEFEKTFKQYDSESDGDKGFHKQQIFLSFMDGVLNNEHKILFLLTTNENINEYFINRPSRIKFVVEYNELPEQLFNLITQDKLKEKKYLEDLEKNVSLINLNIDLLISIIEDINLFDKPFSEFKELYNYTFEHYKYEVSRSINGVENIEPMYYTYQRIRNTDNHVNNHYIKEWIKFTKEEIIYSAMVYDENQPKGKTVEALFKLVPFTSSASTKYTF